MRVEVEPAPTSGAQRDLVNLSIAAIEMVLDCDILALVAQDEKGVYVRFRPGDEANIARRIESVDWRAVRAVAEEQSA